jgi:hypothetical protein
LRRLLLRRKPHRAVYADVVVMPLLDVVVHLPVAMDACPYVEELWDLEAGVPEHRHRRLRAQKMRLSMEKPGKIRSKTSLSRASLHHPHLTWWM